MWDFLVKGGPLMWPILLCSIWALAVIAERGWTFSRVRRFILAPLRNASGHVLSAEREKAVEVKNLVHDPVSELISIGMGELYSGTSRDEKERRMTRLGTNFLRSMEEHLRSLAIIGSITPILGLLGTVTGMIKAFMTIQELQGQVDASVLAGGIWEALMTTAFGLAVAIPTQIAYHYFEGRVDDMADEIGDMAHNLLEYTESR